MCSLCGRNFSPCSFSRACVISCRTCTHDKHSALSTMHAHTSHTHTHTHTHSPLPAASPTRLSATWDKPRTPSTLSTRAARRSGVTLVGNLSAAAISTVSRTVSRDNMMSSWNTKPHRRRSARDAGEPSNDVEQRANERTNEQTRQRAGCKMRIAAHRESATTATTVCRVLRGTPTATVPGSASCCASCQHGTAHVHTVVQHTSGDA